MQHLHVTRLDSAAALAAAAAADTSISQAGTCIVHALIPQQVCHMTHNVYLSCFMHVQLATCRLRHSSNSITHMHIIPLVHDATQQKYLLHFRSDCVGYDSLLY